MIAAAATAALLYYRKQNEPKPLVLAGTLEARTVNVGSLVGGRVVRLHVDEGQQVVAGQTLVTLETETTECSSLYRTARKCNKSCLGREFAR